MIKINASMKKKTNHEKQTDELLAMAERILPEIIEEEIKLTPWRLKKAGFLSRKTVLIGARFMVADALKIVREYRAARFVRETRR